MKKGIILVAGLAGYLSVQAGSVKDNYESLVKATESRAIDMPAEQLNMQAADTASASMAMIDADKVADALRLVNTWDKESLALDIIEKDNTLQMYVEPTGTDTVECVLVIQQEEEPPLIIMYIEGNNKILNNISIMD
ncbi:MAG: hypothetical protein NC402_07495 [Prevotella sp.]|nr:hypothetical protein [Prevotella sp.]MCM1074232.1 hypothetical protein [Ruminococcus sp.]